jgi:fructose-1,6-bisphosphatase/inositol monophosphatase family enzyme
MSASVSDSTLQALLALVRRMQRAIRDGVVLACEQQSVEALSRVEDDAPGDTTFGIDRVGEAVLFEQLEADAARLGGILLVAEGLEGGEVALPRGARSVPVWRFIVDPIDGTRGLMYQKRSAWVLTAVAPNHGDSTRLRHSVLAVQTEIPILKQHLSDELWAIAGQGAHAERFDRLQGSHRPLAVKPSSSPTIRYGYAMLSRFFPGARAELAAIDDEVALELLGPAPVGKALCFEEQYASSGGQLYELMIGHDRFNADLRPLMAPALARQGQALGLCCHPYDVCTALIAREAGVILTDPSGAPLDAPMNVSADVAWVGYANAELQSCVEPVLRAALARRGLLGPAGHSAEGGRD